MKNKPTEVYLQVGEDCLSDADFNTLDGVSWSKEKINANDIKYINAENTPLLDFFMPIVFKSVDELDKKLEELNVKVDEWGKPYDRLRSLAGYRYRVENIKSALYYLKMKRLSGEELEVFLDQDFKEIKKDFYTWKNGNISALFVIEFVD